MIYSAAPAYTINGTQKKPIDELNEGFQDCSPGPVYNTFGQGIKTKTLSYSPSKFRRTMINEGTMKTPGPSDYNPEKKFSNPKVSFAKSQRINVQQKSKDPDPAYYEPNNNNVKPKLLQYTMGSKYPSIMDNTGYNPGPGDYQAQMTKTSQFLATKKSKFSTSPKLAQEKTIVPGPGDYELKQKNGMVNEKCKFGTSMRMIDKKMVTPSPAEYSTRSLFDYNKDLHKGKSMGKKFEGAFNTESNTVESFNNYFRDKSTQPKPQAYTIGKQKRQIFVSEEIPGPFDYKTQDIKKNTPNALIPKYQYKEYNDIKENPGPGNYKTKEYTSTKYSIPRSKSIDYLNNNPGAGKYETDKGISKQKSKGSLFGKSQRTNFVDKGKPGVGDYQILQKKTGGISIPKAERFDKKGKIPGPGDYNCQSTMGNFNLYKKTF